MRIILPAVFFLLVLSISTQACQPEFYFLFRDEARTRLDSLNASPSKDNIFDRFILMHNLAFHKYKKMREDAEKLARTFIPDSTGKDIFNAYKGSLKMIQVSQSKIGTKILKSINPLTSSPIEEARKGFKIICDAVEKDPDNRILRCLRVTAATESAEHLPEMFNYARNDLEWLDSCVAPSDSIAMFFVNLNWAKYYYKLGRKRKHTGFIRQAHQSIARAGEYACTPVYSSWATEWKNKIEKNIKDTKSDEN